MSTTHRIPAISFFIGLAFLLTQLSSATLLPAFPIIVQYFQVPASAIKMFVAIYFAGYTVGQILWGSLSDRFGRRKMYLISLILYLIIAILIVHSSKLTAFYCLYACIGFAAAAYTSVGNALVKDLFSKDLVPTAIAGIGIIMACGPTVGSMTGNWLTHTFNWHSIFIFLAGIATIVLLGVIFVVPETTVKSALDDKSFYAKLCYILKNKCFISSIITLAFSFGAIMSYLDAAPFIYSNYFHLTTLASGWYLSITSASYLIGAVIVSLYIRKKGQVVLTRLGISLFLIATLLLVLVAFIVPHSLFLFVLCSTLIVLGLGMLVPLGKTGCMMALDRYNGTTASLMKFIQSFGVVISISIISHLNTSTSLFSMVCFFLVCSVVCVISVRIFRS